MGWRIDVFLVVKTMISCLCYFLSENWKVYQKRLKVVWFWLGSFWLFLATFIAAGFEGCDLSPTAGSWFEKLIQQATEQESLRSLE